MRSIENQLNKKILKVILKVLVGHFKIFYAYVLNNVLLELIDSFVHNFLIID
jgi:hypothetical protein